MKRHGRLEAAREYVEAARGQADPQRMAAILRRAREAGVSDRILREAGLRDTAGYAFDEKGGRFRKQDTPIEGVPAPTTPAEFVARTTLEITKGAATQSDSRYKRLRFPQQSGVAAIPHDMLPFAFRRATSPVERAEVVRQSITCSHAVLGTVGLKGTWGNYQERLPSADKPSSVFAQSLPGRPPLIREESSPPTWSAKMYYDTGLETPWPLVRQDAQLFEAADIGLPLERHSVPVRIATRRLAVVRSVLFVASPDIADLILPDPEAAENTFTALEADAASEMDSILTSAAAGEDMSEMMVPAVAELSARQVLEMYPLHQ